MAAPVNQSPVVATAAADVVGIFLYSDVSQVFSEARPLQATISETGKLMEHPLEDGSVITDHLVQNPTEITLPVVIGGDYKPVVAKIRQTYRTGTLLIIQTRTGTYGPMAILEFPHEETTEAVDVVTMTLKFREARFVKPAQGAVVPRHKKQAKTTNRGQVQSATAPPAARGSFLFRHVPVH